MTTTSDARKRLAEEHADRSAPTPAPAAVPEGGWRDGDWVVAVTGIVYRTNGSEWVRGSWAEDLRWFDDNLSEIVYVHAPRENARPEPVVAPLPSEAEALAQVASGYDDLTWANLRKAPEAVDLWLGVAGRILAAGYRLVPVDDEDTVRVPKEELDTLRRQVAAVRSLAELDRKDAFLAPGSKIKRVQEDRRCDLGAIVTTSMVAVDDVREALDGVR